MLSSLLLLLLLLLRLPRRRNPRAGDGRTEVHSAPRRRHLEIDAAFTVFRTAELLVQHVWRLRGGRHTGGSRSDRQDNVGIDRSRNVRLRPEPVSERWRMRGTGRRRRFRVPLSGDARRRRLLRSGRRQR